MLYLALHRNRIVVGMTYGYCSSGSGGGRREFPKVTAWIVVLYQTLDLMPWLGLLTVTSEGDRIDWTQRAAILFWLVRRSLSNQVCHFLIALYGESAQARRSTSTTFSL